VTLSFRPLLLIRIPHFPATIAETPSRRLFRELDPVVGEDFTPPIAQFGKLLQGGGISLEQCLDADSLLGACQRISGLVIAIRDDDLLKRCGQSAAGGFLQLVPGADEIFEGDA
jgi:hypothetical protein